MDEQRLRTVPLFAELSRGERRRIAAVADEIDIPAGTNLTRAGAFSHEFFAIEDGTATVRVGDREVGTLGPGDFFGEIGVLGEDGQRTADVVTTSPMTAIVLTGQDLRGAVHDMPRLAARVREAMAARMASTA